MCRAYDKTARIFDNIVRTEILRRNKELSYEDIINLLKSNGAEALRYSATSTIKDRLNHLEAVGFIDYDYSNHKYRKKRRSFLENKKRRGTLRLIGAW